MTNNSYGHIVCDLPLAKGSFGPPRSGNSDRTAVLRSAKVDLHSCLTQPYTAGYLLLSQTAHLLPHQLSDQARVHRHDETGKDLFLDAQGIECRTKLKLE